MLKKIGLVSVALMAAACSGGGGGDAAIVGPNGMPPSTNANSAPSVMTSQISGQPGIEISATIAVTDADGDTTTLTMVSGPEWLSLTPNGQLSGTPSMDDFGTFDLVVEVSDGEATTSATISVNVFTDPIEQAFRTGDFTYISEQSDTDVPSVFLDEIAKIRARNKAAITEIYQLNPDGSLRADSLTDISWAPQPLQLSRLGARFGRNAPLLITNSSPIYSFANRSDVFGVIGEQDAARYLVLGASPFRAPYDGSSQFHQVLKNTVSWLIGVDPEDGMNIVFAEIEEGRDRTAIRDWFDNAYGSGITYNEPTICDGAGLDPCIADDTDLLVVFQNAQGLEAGILTDLIEQAMADGIPLIHVHDRSQRRALGNHILDLVDVGFAGNIMTVRTRLSGASPLDKALVWEPGYVANTEALITGIEAGTLDYDLSVCTGVVECPENQEFNEQTRRSLNGVRGIVHGVDTNKLNPFDPVKQNRFLAALLLTGDYYRSLTKFPMPKASTPSTEIIRAIFGENSAVMSRKFNPAMPDLGTYSRTEFVDGLLTDATLSMVSAEPFKTSGLYALPGETVTVTRIDSERTWVFLQVQSLKEDSGQPFRTIDGTEYNRPARISSNQIRVDPGETVEFTSVFGGPIHLYFNTDGQEVELEFENIAEHPVWRGAEDNEKFLIDLAADQFDWAELATPHFEVHSTAEKMRESLANAKYDGPGDIAEAINDYLRAWPLWLDGQQGDGVRDNPDLAAFQAESKLINLPVHDTLVHMNAEQASCESGCGANPYDSDEAFDPLAYYDQYLVAKGLANTRLRFSGGSGDAISDLYIAHSSFRHFQETGQQSAVCPELPFEDLYGIIQAGHANGDPVEFITDGDLTEADQQNAIYVQLMAALEDQGALSDGWHLLPRHHLIMHDDGRTIYRNFWVSKDQQRALCFQLVLAVEARRLSRNDWLLVTLSCAAQRNLTAYLEMWGYEFLDSIKAHIARRNFPPLEPAFYAIPATGHCTSLAYPELPIDGTSVWPN